MRAQSAPHKCSAVSTDSQPTQAVLFRIRAIAGDVLVCGPTWCFSSSCARRREPLDPVKFNVDWAESSHGQVAPSYGVVFPQDSVNRIEIVLSAAQWASIRTNMSSLWGFDFGSRVAEPCC